MGLLEDDGVIAYVFLCIVFVCRPYSIKQYRGIKPKEYHEIPNLKPDMNREDLKAKRANLDRIKEFSKNLQNVNKAVLSDQKKVPSASEMADIKVSKQKGGSNFARATEYARNVPKPKVVREEQSGPRAGRRPRAEDDGYAGSLEADGGEGHYVMQNDVYGADYATSSKMEALDNKHLETKRQVDAIKKAMGLKG